MVYQGFKTLSCNSGKVAKQSDSGKGAKQSGTHSCNSGKGAKQSATIFLK